MAGNGRIKGPAKAHKAAAVRRSHHVILDRQLEELLFAEVDVLSEGSVRDGAFYGSTMITIDLGRVEGQLRRPLDVDGRAELLAAVDGSVRVRIRAMRLALDEIARRYPSDDRGTAHVETKIEISGDKLHLDVDLEVPFGVSSAERR